ncbi:hypothetical protein DUNSADRAFT_174 [Dunaliella salina]|uniref:Uncharacterized protein n=1 Tax=Dunaliella salina TaxID=3046 RepID=A0ABQ7FZE5_DUNSA|nr:hypothetical protein DUNSADRAFT_174 [Dunaliella salina]|eukprot:KAF5827720.1 hypothetical protein DUNSADRAFT_174 [Dunaliella salina]
MELEKMLVTKQQNTMLQEANATLKAQIEENGKQFSSIQSAITKSNKVFDQYKKDADIASKQRAQLLLDCEAWKSKCIAAAQQVEQLQKKLELASVDPDEVKRLRTQKEALEGLCRSLQAQVKGKSGKQEAQEGGELRPPPQSSPSNEV